MRNAFACSICKLPSSDTCASLMLISANVSPVNVAGGNKVFMRLTERDDASEYLFV
jgi:hypothetical protein